MGNTNRQAGLPLASHASFIFAALTVALVTGCDRSNRSNKRTEHPLCINRNTIELLGTSRLLKSR